MARTPGSVRHFLLGSVVGTDATGADSFVPQNPKSQIQNPKSRIRSPRPLRVAVGPKRQARSGTSCLAVFVWRQPLRTRVPDRSALAALSVPTRPAPAPSFRKIQNRKSKIQNPIAPPTESCRWPETPGSGKFPPGKFVIADRYGRRDGRRQSAHAPNESGVQRWASYSVTRSLEPVRVPLDHRMKILRFEETVRADAPT